MITPRTSVEVGDFLQKPVSRAERMARWFGWMRIERHEREMAFAVKAVASAAESDRLRSALTEATTALYEFTLRTLNEERAKWLAADLGDVHQLDSDALVFGELFLNLWTEDGERDLGSPDNGRQEAILDAADRFRAALHRRRPL